MKSIFLIFLLAFSQITLAQSIMNLHMNNGVLHQYPVNDIDSVTYSLAVLPTVITNNVSGTSNNSTNAFGEITNNGGTAITNRGFCWSSSPNPDITDNTVLAGSGLGSFSSSILGLSSNSTYFLRAFATNSMGTAYGNEVTFNTTAGAITLSTVSVSPINAKDAFINVLISDDEGVTPTSRGVCYSTNPNPTTSNQVVNSGSGLGTFTKNINGLNSGVTYYVRAFATNSTGTYYGNELSFTTLNVSASIGTTGPGGGKIFYDKGYFSNGWQYMEVMTSMAIPTNAIWSPSPFQVVNTPATLVGEGDINTTNTTAIYGTGSYAASVCENSTMGGVSNWYLPNVNEWLVMRQNIGPLLAFTGNFYYWSSEEIDANNAILMIENSDYITTQITLPKSDPGRCRCIRKF
jgi:hypothetical protein